MVCEQHFHGSSLNVLVIDSDLSGVIGPQQLSLSLSLAILKLGDISSLSCVAYVQVLEGLASLAIVHVFWNEGDLRKEMKSPLRVVPLMTIVSLNCTSPLAERKQGSRIKRRVFIYY